MDWDKLRVFHAVAKAGSLTGAGEAVNLSQSAVSRQISSLEDSLGVSLFRRHARGLTLTEQGEILHSATRDMFVKLSHIKDQLSDTRDLPAGPLTITVSEFIGSTWLAPMLADFRNRYPDIHLSVIFEDKILNLGMREADAAIRLGKPKEPELVQRHLAKINFHICASQKYFKKHGYPKKMSDLKNHMLIGFPENIAPPFSDVNWLLKKAASDEKAHKNALRMNSMYAIGRAVVTGAGIAMLPDYMILRNKSLEVIFPEIKSPSVDMYFIYSEDIKNFKRTESFRDFLIENISKTRFGKDKQ